MYRIPDPYIVRITRSPASSIAATIPLSNAKWVESSAPFNVGCNRSHRNGNRTTLTPRPRSHRHDESGSRKKFVPNVPTPFWVEPSKPITFTPTDWPRCAARSNGAAVAWTCDNADPWIVDAE